MAAAASDRTTRWEPFGVTEADFAAVPERDGVRVVNVTPGAGGPGPGQAGWWLRGAAVALAVLAAAAAAVSWDAQYAMVRAVKPVPVVAALEAGIPDVGAVVFAALGVALALHGKRAVRSRALNAACIGISLGMNALAAGRGWRDLAIWVMPAAVYAVASDTLIGVVRAWVLARARQQGETLADDGLTPLAAAAGLALWLLRLSLAPRSTLTGFRSWVITDCPVAPGLRPGHQAELEAARQDADQRIALAAREHDEALAEAATAARQARDEAAQARAAEKGIRAELDRTRADANQRITQALADASRERSDLRSWAEQQAERLRAELQQVREDAACLVGHVRDSAADRIAALEEATARLQAERDQLAADLRAAHRPPRTTARAQREAGPPGSRAGRATKRDQMIALAGQRRDLASLPLAEVSQLASSVAAQIGYSSGTARRELVRHVRSLQAASTGSQSTPDKREGSSDD
jgi:hypothetical protein